jgi:hypothetical protein
MYEEDAVESDLNLTPEELEILRSEGMLPNDWEPGQPSKEDLTLPNGPIQKPQEGEEVTPTGPLSQPQPGDISSVPGTAGPLTAVSPIPQGKELLTQLHAASTPAMDPMAQKFHELAVSWLPTNDDDLKVARTNAQKAADQLASLRAAAQTKAGQFPMSEFGAALLAGGYGSFPQKYGEALLSAQDVQRKNLATAQKLGLDEAEGTARQALGQEASVYKRMEASAAMERAAATMQRYGAGIKSAPTSEIGRAVTAMGYDLNTPEGQLAARRYYTAQHGTPEMKEAVASTPATVDPNSPEFQAALGKVFQRKESKATLELTRAEQQIEASKQATAASRAQVAETIERTKKLQRDAESNKTNIEPDADLAQRIGIPVAQTNPYAQSDTKGQNSILNRETSNFNKRTIDLSHMIEENQQHVTDVQNMANLLNGGFQTGNMYLGGDKNPLKYINPQARAFDAAASRTVNLSKPQGMTRVTNYEEKLIKQGAISLDKPTAVNKQALASAQVMFRLQPMKLQAMQDYFDVNHHLGGFDRHWDEYLHDTFYPDGKTFQTPTDPNSFPEFNEWWQTHGSKKVRGKQPAPSTGGADPLGIR